MRRFLLIAALGALAWTCQVAVAQASLPQEIITASQPLTDADRKRIDEFVAPRVEWVATGDPSEIIRARQELGQQARTPGASAIFRRAYADSVRAALRPIIESGDEFRVANALMVLPTLQTSESLNELAENASRQKQPREAIRIMASRLLAVSASKLAGPNPEFAFDPGLVEPFARKISEAAAEETSWVALAELGTAVAAVGNWKSLNDDKRDYARGQLLQVLEREISLAKSDPPSNAMRAVQRTLGDLQQQILEMRGTSREEFARRLQPLLKTIRELGQSPPTALPEDTLRAYEKAVKGVDLIDRMLATR